MAQRIETYCDKHLAKGEDVPGATWRIAVQVPGGKLASFDVDACADCASDFVDLASYLNEHGRPVGKRANAASDETPESERTCPVCGFVSKSRPAMMTHVRASHDTTVGAVQRANGAPTTDAPEDATAYPCPDCGRGFATPQGLGSHRARSHGYRSGDDT